MTAFHTSSGIEYLSIKANNRVFYFLKRTNYLFCLGYPEIKLYAKDPRSIAVEFAMITGDEPVYVFYNPAWFKNDKI